jgi:putative hydrolase of the HAD superfamily
MIKAVLWDFGGVMTTSPFEAFNRYEAEHGIPRDFIRKNNTINPETNAWARFESGAMTPEEFDRVFAEETQALGHRIAGARVIELLSGDVRPRMVSALKACKAHFVVACLTNNVKRSDGEDGAAGAPSAHETRRASQIREVLELFDLIVESSKEGIRKPNPRFYELACNRLGIEPTDAVFLDDLGMNLKPARDLGMMTIKVVTEAQALADLERILGIPLP